MSKNKSPKKTEASKPVTASDPNAKPKKPRKPRDPNAIKQPWNARQIKRLAKAGKAFVKLQAALTKHAPKLGDLGAEMKDTAANVMAGLEFIANGLISDTAVAYKPTVRLASKIDVGAIVRVKRDAETLAAPVFTLTDRTTGKPYLSPELFDGAEVVQDDRTSWFVRCTDGAPRLIAKKLVELA